MSSSGVTAYSRRQARRLGVSVRPSSHPNKKLDVYKQGAKVASVGATGYGDYPTYLRTHGKRYADQRRRLYKQRHERDRLKPGTPGFYADQLLW